MKKPPSPTESGKHSLFDDDEDFATVVDASLFATPEIPDYPVQARFGQWEVLGRIARGGMAEVFLAREVAPDGTKRHVVLKRILPEMEDNAEFVRMFLDEGRMAKRLYHPNVCHVYEAGEIDRATFMTLEWVYGVPLRQVIRRAQDHGGMPFDIGCKIIAQVAAALDYVHRAKGVDGVPLNIVHRDVSPHNVMVSWEGNVKLLDFGIAKTTSRESQTDAGVLKGKYAYVSPEQARGEIVDARSDIFALGVCLWETLTGKPLYHRDTVLATLTAIAEEPVPLVHEIRPTVPPAVDAVIQRATAKNRNDRFKSAAEMQDALSDALIEARAYVEPARIKVFLDAMFDEAEKAPLPRQGAKITGTFSAMTPSGLGQSGSFGPFGQGPRTTGGDIEEIRFDHAPSSTPAPVPSDDKPTMMPPSRLAKAKGPKNERLWAWVLIGITAAALGIAVGVGIALLR
jgi:serine/threonine-protein kinase